MTKIAIDPKSTALVLTDIQKGISGMPLAPFTGDQVIVSARALSVVADARMASASTVR